MSIQFEIETFQSEEIKHELGEYWMRAADQIQLLNRFIFLEWASARVVAGWVPAAKELEWKSKLTYFMWQDMNAAAKLRSRKEEMAANGKITVPSRQVEAFVQDASRADSFSAFAAGWFLEVKTGMIQAYERLMESLDPIFDAPTIEIIEDLLPRKRKQIAWAKDIIRDEVKDPEILSGVSRWRMYVRRYVLHLGGIDGRLDFHEEQPKRPEVEAYGPAPRSRSMPDWLQKTDFDNPPSEVADSLKLFMWHYMTEIQVVDPMCYVFFGVDDMPFEFYFDFSRHIWDETRHHQMGVRRLRQMGFDIRNFPIPYNEDATKELEQFYAELTMFGETCSFTRKKKSMDSYYAKGDFISGMTAEIDIIDERTHVKFGKKWTPALYKQRCNDDRSLDEIVREIMDRWISEDRKDLGKLTDQEKKSLTHFAFCGKVEFKNLNFEKL